LGFTGLTKSKVSSFSDDDIEVRVLHERRMKKNKVRKCWVGIIIWRTKKIVEGE
jgi:hypothetical protein